MPIDHYGISGKICDTLNEIIETNEMMVMIYPRRQYHR
jgi:hypothetical protein